MNIDLRNLKIILQWVGFSKYFFVSSEQILKKKVQIVSPSSSTLLHKQILEKTQENMARKVNQTNSPDSIFPYKEECKIKQE